MATIKTTIQIRRDTTANWETNGSFVPAEGEPSGYIVLNCGSSTVNI